MNSIPAAAAHSPRLSASVRALEREPPADPTATAPRARNCTELLRRPLSTRRKGPLSSGPDQRSPKARYDFVHQPPARGGPRGGQEHRHGGRGPQSAHLSAGLPTRPPAADGGSTRLEGSRSVIPARHTASLNSTPAAAAHSPRLSASASALEREPPADPTATAPRARNCTELLRRP